MLLTRILPFLLLILLSKNGFSQDLPNTYSAVYSWQNELVKVRPQGEVRQFLEGSTPTFKLLKVHATTLNAKSRMRENAYSQENEELIIVKKGVLTVTIEGVTKELSAGGIALIMSGDIRATENKTDKTTTYYVIQLNAKEKPDLERSKKAGGSLLINFDEIAYKAHDKGGRRNFFDRPTSMATRFEMHVTTLNTGKDSHEPHTHLAPEIILMIDNELDSSDENAEMYVSDKWVSCTTGDVSFVNSKVPHAIKNTSKGSITYFAFQFE
jgi:(S)-ureidoglycine aminohydrolase